MHVASHSAAGLQGIRFTCQRAVPLASIVSKQHGTVYARTLDTTSAGKNGARWLRRNWRLDSVEAPQPLFALWGLPPARRCVVPFQLLADGGPLLVPGRGALEGVADFENAGFVEQAADDLQTDGHAP